MNKERKLIAALACRNQGSRLYGKPIQNLDVDSGYRIIDNVVECLQSIECINEVILGISEGTENEVFIQIAQEKNIRYVIGDQKDVLSRLIACGDLGDATDIFRITSESPFLYFECVENIWNKHISANLDATFLDDIIDGCGFEIISLAALKSSHENGESKHRSELCSLYIRENKKDFNIEIVQPSSMLIRKDLRLTVDYPEDLVVCRNVYMALKEKAPRIPIAEIITYLDSNPRLKEMIAPYTEEGYNTMYL